MIALRLLRTLACLIGAAGVVAAAAAAHGGGDGRMAAAAQMLLVHAGAALALTALVPSRLLLAAIGGIEAGAGLFAADMAVRVLADHPLFPMAAPTGGLILIAAWLVAGGALALRRS